MLLLLKWLFSLLWIITYCTSCASSQECVQCSLSCNGVPELNNHDSVIVSIKHPLQDVPDRVYSVSSLCDEAQCSVPGCFQRDTLYTLIIYANEDYLVPKILVDEPSLQPDCDPEDISERKSSADGNFSNMLLIQLIICFWIVFQLEGPYTAAIPVPKKCCS